MFSVAFRDRYSSRRIDEAVIVRHAKRQSDALAKSTRRLSELLIHDQRTKEEGH
jgi:hypothetical protein